MPRPTPSSYAVLGLLSVRPWSPYELIKHMQHSTIHFIWPKAASKLYEEPKRLVDRGLATAAPPAPGERRTTYDITEAGRRELNHWLSEPTGSIALESEALLKVLFAEHATKDELLATLRAIKETTAREMAETLVPVAKEMATGAEPFPERAHLSALVGAFLAEVSSAIGDWAEWAEQEVNSWPSLDPSPSTAKFARGTAQRFLDQLGALSAADGNESSKG